MVKCKINDLLKDGVMQQLSGKAGTADSKIIKLFNSALTFIRDTLS
jgi:hypothetical protein